MFPASAGHVCVCVCVELLKRSKTCTNILLAIILAIFWQYLNLYLGVPLEPGSPHVYLFFGKDFSTMQYIFPSRGHRPIVDTCANEAIPQWGKHDLISHVPEMFG